MDSRDMESEVYGDEHAPPSYYGAAKPTPGAPLLAEPPIFDPQAPGAHFQYQMHPMTVGQRPRDQMTVVAMAPPKTSGEANESYGSCHMACSFMSIFLCLVSGMLALMCAVTGYTDFRTGNMELYKKKRRCAIGWVFVSWVCCAGIIGLYWYLGRHIRYY